MTDVTHGRRRYVSFYALKLGRDVTQCPDSWPSYDRVHARLRLARTGIAAAAAARHSELTPGMDSIIQLLAARRAVNALDLPGFGQSPFVVGANVPAGWVPSIVEVLDRLDMESVSVVGSSMGGWTALELARAGRARAVLALAPAGLWRRHPLITDMRILQGQVLGRLAPASELRRGLTDPRRRR